MPKFVALTSKGLEEVLEKELKELGFEQIEKNRGGFSFETNWQGCYRANLRLRSATRVLLPILDFPAYQPEDIYHNIKKHDFTKYIKPNQTIAVDAITRDSKLRDQRFVALKAKDAIVDQFRDKFDERPSVDKDNPDLFVIIRMNNNQVSVSIDTSGVPLFKRGYRAKTVEAPVKEHLAAGLLRFTDWDKKTPIIDPMCGSGTFLIEAAMMALGISPGLSRKKFAFQGFLHLDQSAWNQEVEACLADEKEELDFHLYGFDIDRKSVAAARANVRAAGLEDYITIERKGVDLLENPLEDGGKGMMVVNPPYGERLGNRESLKDDYRDLSFALKKEFKGWDCWVLSGHADLIAALKLKSSRKIFVMNGPIECRWLRYQVNK